VGNARPAGGRRGVRRLVVTLILLSSATLTGWMLDSGVRLRYEWQMRSAAEFVPVDREWLARITCLGPGVTPLLVKTLAQGGSSAEGTVAYYALAEMHDPRAAELLVELAEDPTARSDARRSACGLLAEMSATEAIPVMGRIVSSENNDFVLRAHAAYALERLLDRSFGHDEHARVEGAARWWRGEGRTVWNRSGSENSWIRDR